jgi:hypothetical protein
MTKYALPVAVLYFAIASVAWAAPGSTLPQLTSPNDIVQVKSKSHKKHSYKKHSYKKHYDKHNYKYGKYHKRYHYHGKYYGHRYAYRPRSIIGCVAAGPIWYCP